MGEIFRQLRVKPERLARSRVDKTQRLSVQTLSPQARDAVMGVINRIARYGMMDGRHMNTESGAFGRS